MFHKEGSTTTQSTNDNKKSSNKAVDVPLRKSDRRLLRDRALTFFLWQDTKRDVSIKDDDDDDNIQNNNHHHHVDVDPSTQRKIQEACDEIFLRGNLAARTLPDLQDVTNKAKTMVLYLKTPSGNSYFQRTNSSMGNDDDDQYDENTAYCPYTTSTQCVWMIRQEKSEPIQETPTIALWAVLYPFVESYMHRQFAVVIPIFVSWG
jgi:hypothetical protein